MQNSSKPTSTVLFDLHNTLIYQSVDLRSHLAHVILNCREVLPDLDLESFISAWLSIEQAQASTTKSAILLLEKDEWNIAEIMLKETPIRMFIKEVLEVARVQIDDQKVTSASDAFQVSWMGGLRVIDGASDLLRQLSTEYRLGIVSNFRDGERMRVWLSYNSLTDYFNSCIVISEEVGIRKPHPRLFEIALDCLEIDEAEHAVYIGDDPLEDILGPQLKGLRVQLVDRSNPDKSHRLRDAVTMLGLLP
jgi:HAD superfamily hydrolase (TIGR01549 family)